MTIVEGIKLYSIYKCNECGEDKFVFSPMEKPGQCEHEYYGEEKSCGCTEFNFDGMVFIESFQEENKEYRLSEPCMESAGIPVCSFCGNRDFNSKDAIEEGWLCKDLNSEPFNYYCACHSCQEKLGFIQATRKELRDLTEGLFEEAESIAEDYQQMLKAQIENDRLNYGEKYVLREYYGYSDEDFENEEEDDI